MLTLLLIAQFAFASEPQTIKIEDVVKKVSTQNFEILESAQKVYQAKESIEIARGNLLPRLNLWSLANVAVDTVMGNVGGAAMGLIEDIAPFLVPSNWFRLDEANLLFLAEKEGYRSLWGNEILTAKGLYFHSLLDKTVLEHVNQNIRELENLFVIVNSREILGGIKDGASREIETRILALKEDRRSLEVLILEETNTLTLLMALPAETDVMLEPLALPQFENLVPLTYKDFEFRVLDSAPEIRQYNSFIDAARFVKKEVKYSFLGSSSQSRGVGGGIFDGLPSQMGLGFGSNSSVQIVNSQMEVLQLQKSAIIETLKRQLKLLIENYNLDLANFSDLKRHADLTNITLKRLYDRLNLGENIDVLDLVEASKNHIEADTAFFAVQYRFLSNQDRLMRLLYQGDYTKDAAVIEWIRGSL